MMTHACILIALSRKMISVCGLGGLDRDGDEGVKCHK